jgi:hypothetical protein
LLGEEKRHSFCGECSLSGHIQMLLGSMDRMDGECSSIHADVFGVETKSTPKKFLVCILGVPLASKRYFDPYVLFNNNHSFFFNFFIFILL